MPKGEIILHVQEGLGNQLFQYAAGRALALRTGRVLKLDLRHYGHPGKRPYQLDLFNIQHSPFVRADRARLAINNSAKWRAARPLVRRITPPFLYKHVLDQWEGYLPALGKLKAPKIYMDGFWQCEKYFSDASETIRKDLTFVRPPTEENQKMIDLIRSKEAPAVLHVRRGDFMRDNHISGLIGDKGLPYYKSAVAAVRARAPGAHFFIFSNDIDWCRGNLPFAEPRTFVSHNSGAQDYEDLRLMTHCRHFILANSSFSWWGAWLAGAADNFVIAPEIWFFDGRGTNNDIVPTGWTKMNTAGEVVPS